MRRKPPQVSVLMAVHNGGSWLTEAVRSVLSQSFQDFELIAMDDGSTDCTAHQLQTLASMDPRIQVYTRAKQGLTRSLNQAAALARGAFLARIDADDVALPERLILQVRRLQQDPPVVALGGQALMIDPDGWPIAPWKVPLHHGNIDAWHLAGHGGGIIHPAAIIRRDAFESIGGYETSLPAAQDFDLWLRLAELGRLANLPDRILLYRLHSRSVTASQRTVQSDCLTRSCLEARKRRGLEGLPKRMRRRYPPLTERRQQLQWVRLALKSGNYATALKHSRMAWRRAPFNAFTTLHLAATTLISLFHRVSPASAKDRSPNSSHSSSPSDQASLSLKRPWSSR